ncbi:MAG: TatD family hydrolase [Gemmatimonadota bacterium]
MTGTRYFDSHLHLTDEAFDGDRPAVLERARRAGVRELVTVSSDPVDARRALELARAEEGVWCTVGLHPHGASAFSPAVLEEIGALAREEEVVAIGETGLDFHYDHSRRPMQMECFESQLELAAAVGKAAVVHSRDADADMASLIRRCGRSVRGVLHCFTGGDSLLDAGLDAGWFVSFSGIVTFKRFGGLSVVRRVPEDRLLIETDSPYLSPVPLRGKRNEPARLPLTCEAVAAMRGQDAADVAAYTRRNARVLYGLR